MTITLKSKKVDLLIIFYIYNINDYLDKYYNGHF
ncbi:unknown [Tannerella sp. CAG:118]|nr:unknown [Tannerella sp. CAG:118]